MAPHCRTATAGLPAISQAQNAEDQSCWTRGNHRSQTEVRITSGETGQKLMFNLLILLTQQMDTNSPNGILWLNHA